jgi:NAD(P)-dependent dehydrogenase (short-subunit alcohol dehydrogenase family)
MSTPTDNATGDPEVHNTKAGAWDLIGSLFWEVGRTSAKPSTAEIGLFLADVPAGARCSVVGASTKDLVEALVAHGAEVTVLDFSERMCHDLRAALPEGCCRVLQHDITRPAPDGLRGTQQFVLSDRLVNRFTAAEAEAGLAGMLDLLADGGQVRTSVKLGFYPMDQRMIDLGRERGCLERFYDAAQRTIDFSAAGDVLPDALLPHGGIAPELLLDWYRGRGREKRFDDADLVDLIGQARVTGRALRLLCASEFPEAPSTRLYVAEAVTAGPGA